MRDPAKRRPRDVTFVWDFGSAGSPYYGDAFWFYEAYVAASFARDAEARKLLHAGLRQNQHCVEAAYNEGGWQSFARGIVMLQSGSPRQQVLAQWKETLRFYGGSRYGPELLDLTAQLEKQVIEDEKLRAANVADPEKLPVEQRIEYYLARLPDVHGMQMSQPGTVGPWAWGRWAGTWARGRRSATP